MRRQHRIFIAKMAHELRFHARMMHFVIPWRYHRPNSADLLEDE
jgi:hypothetical protein